MFTSPGLDAIKTMLETEKVTLRDILLNTSFTQGIRSGFVPLVNYVLMDDIMRELFGYIFSSESCDNEDLSKIVRNSLLVFTSNCLLILEKLKVHPVFLDMLSSFIENPSSSNPKVAGHFQRIIECFMRHTNGSFCSAIPWLHSFLCKNLHLLGYKELLVGILVSYPSSYGLSKEFFSEMLSFLNAESCLNILTAIHEILKIKKDYIKYLDNPETIECILEVLISPHRSNLCKNEAVYLLKQIQCHTKSDNCMAVFKRYQELFSFNSDVPLYIIGGAICIFKVLLKDHLALVFDMSVCTSFKQSVISVLPFIQRSDLSRFVHELSLPNLIMTSFGEYKTNSQVIDLAVFLKSNPDLSQSLMSQQWIDFVSNRLDPYIEQRTKSYGGEKPLIESSDFNETNETTLAFVPPDLPLNADNSSSDSDSDDENDPGGYENAKTIAKYADMMELHKQLEDDQAEFMKSYMKPENCKP